MKTFKEKMARLAVLRKMASDLAEEKKVLESNDLSEMRELESLEGKVEEIRLISDHLKKELKADVMEDVRKIQAEHSRMKNLLRDAMTGAPSATKKEEALSRLKRSVIAIHRGNASELRKIQSESREAMTEEERANFQNETTDSEGGAIVETELMRELIREQSEQGGIMRSLVRVVPMSSDEKKANTLSGQAIVSMVGEASIGLQSTFVFGDKKLKAKKMHAKVLGTNEWIEDNWTGEQIWTALKEIIIEGFGLEEDAQMLLGSGEGNNLEGILVSDDENIAIHTSDGTDASGLTSDVLLDLQLALPTALNRGNKVGYLMNKMIWANILKTKSTTGEYIIRQPIDKAEVDAGILGYIWNRPVFSCDSMPASVSAGEKYVVFANFEKACYLGHRKSITFKKLTEATITVNVGDAEDEAKIDLADQDIEALKATQRIGFKVVRGKGIAILKSSAS